VNSFEAKRLNLEAGVAQSMWRLMYEMNDLHIGDGSPAGKRMFLFPKASRLGLELPQPLTELIMEIHQLG
jgi:hypothetical protein